MPGCFWFKESSKLEGFDARIEQAMMVMLWRPIAGWLSNSGKPGVGCMMMARYHINSNAREARILLDQRLDHLLSLSIVLKGFCLFARCAQPRT